MNQQEALEVKDLVKDTVEALGVVTERECEICQGKGRVASGAAPFKDCPKCNGTGKAGGWKWQPEVNQTVLYDKKLMFIVSISQTRLILLPFDIPDFRESLEDYVCTPEIVEVTPILEWEQIEGMLEGMGYSYAEIDLEDGWWEFQIERKDSIVGAREKSRQQAVMRAVIKLGEEINAKSK